MIRPILLVAVLALSGCASIDQAGTSSLSITPVMVNGKPQGWALDVRDGKQYASIDIIATKTGDDYSLRLSARGVEAFRGQEIAAGATARVAGAAAAVLAPGIPMVLPEAGAALAAPEIGAAAVGAGALAVGHTISQGLQPLENRSPLVGQGLAD